MKAHPLEETFEIEPNPEFIPAVVQGETMPAVIDDRYDDKDNDIDDEFDTIYKKALSAYGTISEEMEFVEGKYMARVGEVSNQFLNTALSAAKEKAGLKAHKDKMVVKSTGTGVTNNNLFVGSHEELLKVLQEANGASNEDDS